MEKDELIEVLKAVKSNEKDGVEISLGTVLKYVGGILASIFIFASTTSLVWVVSGISDNKTSISNIRVEIDKQDETLERVMKVMVNFQEEFREFSKLERYTRLDAKDNFYNFENKAIKPIDLRLQVVEKKQLERTDRFKELDDKIDELEDTIDDKIDKIEDTIDDKLTKNR